MKSFLLTSLMYVKILYKAASNEELPPIIMHSLVKRINKSLKVGNKTVSIKKHDFLNKDKGFSLAFTIKHE